MTPSALEFLSISKTYRQGLWGRKALALEGVSFAVPAGGIFGFLGANGAGKTTAIKILLGLQSANSGEARLLGALPHEPEARARVGYLPERPYFHLNLTGNEFLNFHRSLYGRPFRGHRGLSNEKLFERVGLSGVGERLLRGFSKGMLQRIGVAQALINEPDLLIFDEPMSGLDPIGRREVRNLIVDISRQGKTVFFSSHILSDIESICDRIAFLDKGYLKFCGSLSEALASGRRETEILFRSSARPNLPPNLDLETYGDGYRLLVPEEALAQGILVQLVSGGARIVSYQQVHKSLEDILFGEDVTNGSSIGRIR